MAKNKKILKMGSQYITPITGADCVYMPGTNTTINNHLVDELAKKSDITHIHTADEVGARPNTWVPSWTQVTNKPTTFPAIIGEGSTDAYRGDRGKIAYDHSQAAHAPVNAQPNADITQAEIEAKLTGSITSHDHNGLYYTETEVNNLLDGKADSGHGTHVTYATVAGKANGDASAGTSTKVAREDHVHPLQTTISGNAGSATKLETARNITIGDADAKAFDGTDNLSWTLDEIGAAPKGHRHNDLYYTIDAMKTQLAGKANNIHGNHVPDKEVANNARFLRNDNTWQTITPSNIGASAEGHTHDDRYYTESEINTKVTTLEGKITAAETAAKDYTDDKIEEIIGTATETMDTLGELAQAIADNKGTVDGYVSTLNSNIATAKSEAIAQAKKDAQALDATLKAQLQAEIDADVLVETNRAKAAEAANNKAINDLSGVVEGKAEAEHGIHLPELETANNARFLRNDNTWATVTPANIGAAKASHGTHLDLGTGAGNAYYGDKGKIAYDHSQKAHAPADAQKNADITQEEIEAKLIGEISSHTHAEVTQSNPGLMTATDKVKLDAIEANANNYVHPTSHAASMITESTTRRFVSDAEKAAWNAKAETSVATTSANGLMSADDKKKLNGIAAGAEVNQDAYGKVKVGAVTLSAGAEVGTLTLTAGTNVTLTPDTSTNTVTITSKDTVYTHPSHTAVDTGMYKVKVNALGHVTSVSAINKSDITDLGIPGSDTTYENATQSASGLMSIADKKKLDGIASGAQVNADITQAEIEAKLTGTITTHTHNNATTSASGLMSASDKSKLNGIAEGAEVNQNAFANVKVGDTTIVADAKQDTLNIVAGSNVTITTDADGDSITIAAKDTVYTHPGYTAKSNGLYKVTVDGTGHVSGTSAVTSTDIANLGVKITDTTYVDATTSASGLMSADDKMKLDGIASGANKYIHPSTHAATMITQDASNRFVSDTQIAAWNAKAETTVASQSANGLMAVADKKKLDGIASGAQVNQNAFSNVTVGESTISADNTTDTLTIAAGDNVTITPDTTNDKITISAKDTIYTHPGYTAKSNGFYKVTVDSTGHVSGTSTVAKSDITALGIPGQDTTYADATQSVAGLMSAADKKKLDGIDSGANKYSHPSTHPATMITEDTTHRFMTDTERSKLSGIASGAEVNQNAFSNITVGDTTLAADSATDTLTIAAGGNITLTPDDTTGTLTIAATDTVYTHPSHTAAASGLYKVTVDNKGHVTGTTAVVKDDITKLGIPAQDTVYNHPSTHAATMITQDSNHKFVTDTQISTWDAKASTAAASTTANGLMTSAMVTKLNSISSGAQVNADITKAEIEAKLTGDIDSHNHNSMYYTESEIDSKLSGKANASHGNHVPATQTASNKVFLRNDNTWATVTPANIGAAAASHTHDDIYYTESEIDTKINTINTAITTAKNAAVSSANSYTDTKVAALVDSAPDALNTLNELATAINSHQDVYDAYVDEVSAALAAKSDTNHTHKYAGSASAGGAATSANKVNSSLKVQLNGGTTEGTSQFTFDGSAAKTINITPSSIGAAASHSHDSYVNKNAFANIKVGSTTVAADAVQDTVEFVAGSNITITPDATNDKITIAATDTVYTHPAYTAKSSGLYKITVDATGHVSATTAVAKSDITALGIPGSDTNTWRGVQDNLTSTATDQSLSANQGKVLKGLIDGKLDASHANVTHLTIGTGAGNAAAGNHTHSAYVNQNAFSNVKVGDTTVAADAVQDTLTLAAGSNITITPDATNDTITISSTNTTYSAASQSVAGLMSAADKKKLDGIADSANNYSHPSSGATDGSYGPSANAAPAHGGTFSVPYLTVNATGHVTAVSTKTITLPGDNNTWRGVQDNLTSTAKDQSLSANQGKVLKGLIDTHASTTHLTLGTGSGNAFRGDYGNTAYNHSQAAHAPSNAQKNSDITQAEIEAKLTGNITTHTHSYIPMSGNTGAYSITGNVEFASPSDNVFRGVVGKCGTNDYWRVGGSSTASNSGYMEIATADDNNEPIYVRQYSGAYATKNREAVLLDANGNTKFPGSVTVNKVEMKYNADSESLDFIFV